MLVEYSFLICDRLEEVKSGFRALAHVRRRTIFVWGYCLDGVSNGACEGCQHCNADIAARLRHFQDTLCEFGIAEPWSFGMSQYAAYFAAAARGKHEGQQMSFEDWVHVAWVLHKLAWASVSQAPFADEFGFSRHGHGRMLQDG